MTAEEVHNVLVQKAHRQYQDLAKVRTRKAWQKMIKKLYYIKIFYIQNDFIELVGSKKLYSGINKQE